jgi:DNA (cytosine-5)-methyltransferase 1
LDGGLVADTLTVGANQTYGFPGEIVASTLTSHPSRIDGETENFVTVCPTLRAGGNKTGGNRPPGTDVDTADSLIVTHYLRGDDVARTLSARHDGSPCADRGPNVVAVPQIAPTLTSNGDAHLGYRDAAGLAPISFDLAQITSAANRTRAEPRLPSSTLAKGSAMHVAFAFDPGQSDNPKATHQFCEEHTAPLIKERVHAVGGKSAVRRLTPRECERLQGFPDDYTLVPYRGKTAADGPRYKALGNSMAVPVMRWIGERIQMMAKAR